MNASDRPQRRVEGPRRVRHGIRLKRKEGLETLPEPARRWLDVVYGRASVEARLLGLEYALAGQVASFTIAPGSVEALVQGRAARPYPVKIECSTLDRPQWDAVIQAMAHEAIFAAKLLAGGLPASIEAPFEAAGTSLLPRTIDELVISCPCGDPMPCKHVIAVAILVAERIEVDAPVLLTLRGLSAERVLERLQQARAVLSAAGPAPARTAARSNASGSLRASSALPPIESCLHDFWRPGRSLAEFESAPPGHHAPHALLRRLGPSPIGGRFPLVGLLASAYDTIRASAQRWLESETGAPPESARNAETEATTEPGKPEESGVGGES